MASGADIRAGQTGGQIARAGAASWCSAPASSASAAPAGCSVKASRSPWSTGWAPGEATSYGNAGGVATGEIVPLAVPGLLREVPGWLLDPLGPLAVDWRYLPRALPWLVRFLRAGSRARVGALAGALAALSHAARPPLEELLAAAGLDDLLAREDCLYLYDHERQLAAEALDWDLRRAHGIPFERIAGPALPELEPDLARDFGLRHPHARLVPHHQPLPPGDRSRRAFRRTPAAGCCAPRRSASSPATGRRWR